MNPLRPLNYLKSVNKQAITGLWISIMQGIVFALTHIKSSNLLYQFNDCTWGIYLFLTNYEQNDWIKPEVILVSVWSIRCLGDRRQSTVDWLTGSVCHVFSCRIKRIEQIDELESEKSQEYLDMEAMEEENARMRVQLQDLQARYAALKKFAILRNIPIPFELDWAHVRGSIETGLLLKSKLNFGL